MNLKIQNSKFKIQNSIIKISGSKSETNRLLLLQSLYPNLEIENASNSDDSEFMVKALLSNETEIDIHHAGTAMRFLTAFFAQKEGHEVLLTGSSRMQERPISVLVDALKQLGADIEYANNFGFPPLSIFGKKLTKNKVSLPANVSSQYISALLLIAPKLENGIELTLIGEITSIPYIDMTLALLNEIGVETSFNENLIIVKPSTINHQSSNLIVESDWSSASYFYSIIALSEIGTEIKLSSFKRKSLQADATLVEIYKDFGVKTTFKDNSIILIKLSTHNLKPKTYNLNNSPDIAQTIAVTCFGLGIGCHLSGLHTLKIKETDRLLALETELKKLGASISVTNNSLTLEISSKINSNVKISTYHDHRMAMAFAPLALKTNLIIENAEVVSKSYPDFWKDLEAISFELEQL